MICGCSFVMVVFLCDLYNLLMFLCRHRGGGDEVNAEDIIAAQI